MDRRDTNPMFNGLFDTNCPHGLTMSHIPTTYKITWEHTKEIAREVSADPRQRHRTCRLVVSASDRHTGTADAAAVP